MTSILYVHGLSWYTLIFIIIWSVYIVVYIAIVYAYVYVYNDVRFETIYVFMISKLNERDSFLNSAVFLNLFFPDI